jgi:hypothetical protein
VITRKSKQKTRLFELKIILRNVVPLMDIIKKKMSQEEDSEKVEQYKNDLKVLSTDSEETFKVKNAL